MDCDIDSFKASRKKLKIKKGSEERQSLKISVIRSVFLGWPKLISIFFFLSSMVIVIRIDVSIEMYRRIIVTHVLRYINKVSVYMYEIRKENI